MISNHKKAEVFFQSFSKGISTPLKFLSSKRSTASPNHASDGSERTRKDQTDF